MHMSEHRSFPKPTPRVEDRTAKRRDVANAWLECRAFVDQRDRYRCRVCQRQTMRTLTLCAERAEHHHIVGRRIAPQLRLDVRNILHCCGGCHSKLTRHELYVEGRAEDMFTSDGRRFWNADYPLHFKPAESATFRCVTTYSVTQPYG